MRACRNRRTVGDLMSRYEEKVKAGAQRFLEPGEQVVAAVVAAPRGYTQAAAGSMQLGAAQQGRATDAAAAAGLVLRAPMALALTQQRLLTLNIGTPIGLGIGGKVKELLSAVPLADVQAIEVKRLALGYTITVTVRGVAFKLEANAASGAKAFGEAFDTARPLTA
jgi:hypothetical protein